MDHQKAIDLIKRWREDTSGYDERVWPRVMRALEENRGGHRQMFCSERDEATKCPQQQVNNVEHLS